MELVAPRLRDDVDDPAGRASELGLVAAGLDLDLLDELVVDDLALDSAVDLVRVDSVDHEHVLRGGRAVDREREPPALRVAGVLVDARLKLHDARVVSTERQLLHDLRRVVGAARRVAKQRVEPFGVHFLQRHWFRGQFVQIRLDRLGFAGPFDGTTDHFGLRNRRFLSRQQGIKSVARVTYLDELFALGIVDAADIAQLAPAVEDEIDISDEWEDQVSEVSGAPEEVEAGAASAKQDSKLIEETVEEVRFYLSQSMVEQARSVFAKLEKSKAPAQTLAELRRGRNYVERTVDFHRQRLRRSRALGRIRADCQQVRSNFSLGHAFR